MQARSPCLRALQLACAAGAFAALPAARAEPPPNVLLVVADDQGYHDLGSVDPAIRTPHLDRLAASGVRLTDFYVAWPACTPSRAAFLTGRYPQRNGLYDMIRNESPDYGYRYRPEEYEVTWERIGGLDLRETLLPEVLAGAGMASGIFGKWDLGQLRRFLPTARGFGEFYGFVNTGIDYYTHERYGVPSMFRGLEPTTEDRGTYATTLFAREALDFLDRHAGKRPFFLYVPFNAPHSSSSLDPKVRGTVQAPPEFEALYPPVRQEFRGGERYGRAAQVPTREKRTRDYRAAVTCMDAAVGALLDALDRHGVADDTIVVFFSDNGGGAGSNNGPLRGHKGDTWEGGVRVLALVRWTSGGVPAGAVNSSFLSSLELLPSLAAAAGADLPEGVTLDGYDWWPCLRGKAESPRREMYWKRRGTAAARVEGWKWVDMGAEGGGLFDLQTDPGEEHDVSGSHPDALAEIKARYQNWLHETMVEAEPRGPFKDY